MGKGNYPGYGSNKLIKQFDDFFISYSNGGYYCVYESPENIKELYKKAVESFENALTSIEEIE